MLTNHKRIAHFPYRRTPHAPHAPHARSTPACPGATGSDLEPPTASQGALNNRLLVGAGLFCVMLLAYQLGVIVFQPGWAGPVTDWLRATLAWPEFAVVAYVGVWLQRGRAPDARSWLLCAAALLSYAIARTLWSIFSVFIYPQGVPFPTVPDPFFALQYPFFLLALIFISYQRRRIARVHLILDSLLWIGAATIIFWTFLLEPFYTVSGLSPLARGISLGYQVMDLFIVCTLALISLRPYRYWTDRIVMGALILAFSCLVVADAWTGLILVGPDNPRHVYRTGQPPDLFWMAFYLLLPLASLIRWRLARHESSGYEEVTQPIPQPSHLRWEDVADSLRFALPLAAALLVSGLILIRAAIALGQHDEQSLLGPVVVTLTLLLLVIARQTVTYLDNARLRHEREATQAAALAMEQTTERMNAFLATAGHDLRTPMGAVVGYIDLATDKCERLATTAQERCRPDEADVVEQIRVLQGYLDQATQGATRTTAVLNRVLASAHGATDVKAQKSACDLIQIAQGCVDDFRVLHPRRTIRLDAPSDAPMIVQADAVGIGQVIANFISNALKYSAEDGPVEVRLSADDSFARLAVSDHGPGIPSAELAHIWERFYRAPGVAVQSGTNIGLGLGLHVCKLVVEQHGGRVGVESVLGSGSTFWFTLPLAEHMDAVNAPAA